MYKTLYRKYRPNSFSEIIGQDYIVNILKNSIENDKISHAYLFYGSHGTGKTSTAKIFSKEVNKLDVNINKIDEYQDILEIDAASNNGVDDIRKLCDNINFSPTSLNYKIYIIDEAHMLSNAAFNALLKTLEETPKHIIFILATTEMHKIPLTISSRCQKFNFNKIDNLKIKELLTSVAKKENINITDDAIEKISNMSNGSLRDALGLLEQISLFTEEKINSFHLKQLYGLSSKEKFDTLLEFIFKKNYLQIINFVNNIDCEYKNIEIFVKDFMNYLLNKILEDNISNIKRENIFIIINKLNALTLKIKDSISLSILLKSCLLELTFLIKNNKKSDSLNENINNVTNITVENKKNNSDEKKSLNTQEYKISNFEKDSIYLLMLKTAFKKEKNISQELKKKILKDVFVDDKISMFLKDMNIPLASDNLIVFTCTNKANIDILMQEDNKNKFIKKILSLINKNTIEIIFIQTTKWESLRKEFIQKYKKELITIDDIEILENKILDYKNKKDKQILDNKNKNHNNINTLEKVRDFFNIEIEEK